MIVDMRTYTIVTGKVKEYLEVWEAEGLPRYTKYIGQPVGYYISEVGSLDQVVHIWQYDSYADREEKRAKLYADEKWLAYLKKNAHRLLRRENRILRPTSFFSP